MLAPCITYLLQLAVLRRRVILADVADRCAWIEVSAAYWALDAVLHGNLTIRFELRIALEKAICNSLVSSIAVHPEPAALPTHGLLSRRSTDRNAVLFRWVKDNLSYERWQ